VLGASDPLTPADEHEDCRLRQFAMWNRVCLEHEREWISKCLASRGFLTDEQYDGLVHDVTDIDWILSMNTELRVKVPNEGSP
jgi:hypothetical protein